MSKYQFGLLNYIRTHRVTLETARLIHGGTLGSCLERKWVTRMGSGEAIELTLTSAGETALSEYREQGMRQRQHEGPLTERCARALRFARTVHMFQSKESKESKAS